jgi:hypothetical protein
VSRVRRATAPTLLALAGGLALLLGMGWCTAPQSAVEPDAHAVRSPAVADAPMPSDAGPLPRATLGRADIHRAAPWPGLAGSWMYRCAVEFAPTGAFDPANFRMRVDGPGLSHRGWIFVPDARGLLQVPELAIGSTYSFTILADLQLLPGAGVDLIAADRFELAPYASTGADGQRLAMRVPLHLAHANASVRLQDAEGRLLTGVEAVVLQAAGTPARLTCGSAHWIADDGSIPLPIPLGAPSSDPFLRILTPADEFQDVPLTNWQLAESARTGFLTLERVDPPFRLRFEAVHLDESPALQSLVFDPTGREVLARPDWSGRFDFMTRERKFLVRTPGYPDQVGLLAEFANDAPVLDDWPRLRVVKPGTLTLSLDASAGAEPSLAQVLIEADGMEAIAMKGGWFSISSISSDPWSGYARFHAPGGCTLQSKDERDLTVTYYWWGRECGSQELTLVPEQDLRASITLPAPVGEPMVLYVVDAKGAALTAARVEIGLPIPAEVASHAGQLDFIRWGNTNGDGRIHVPAWPQDAEPSVRISSRITGTSLTLALREVALRGGRVELPAAREGGPR